jgi:Ca2+-binding EF-hand superfamily protein
MTDDHTRKIKLDTLREVQKRLGFDMDDMSLLARKTAMNAIRKMMDELQ